MLRLSRHGSLRSSPERLLRERADRHTVAGVADSEDLIIVAALKIPSAVAGVDGG